MDIPGRQPPHLDDGHGLPGAAPGLLGQMLLDCAAERRSGALCVSGEPGGVVHFADGAVVAIDTPGAPGPEVILVRSGRVPESGWAAAFTAVAADGRMGAELVRRELIGNGELEAVLRAVVADAMFALASGQVDECQMKQAEAACLLPLEPPAEPAWLLSETSRRQRVLASMESPIAHDRDRVTRGPGAPAGATLDSRHDEILALANGRRTARDMAFVLGCGVYALTLEFARMQACGLLAVGSRRRARPEPPGPGPAAGRPASPGDGQDAGHAHDGDAGPGPSLPRRRKTSRPQNAAGPQGSPSALLRLLRPGLMTDQAADE